jgi:large subunit ribosomal protein L9
MKHISVLLTADVAQVGKKGQVVSVSDGYAKNFLVRNNLAVYLTEGAEKNYKDVVARTKKKIDNQETDAKRLKEDLEQNYTMVLKERSGKEGRLFGAVTSEVIAHKLTKDRKIEIDKRKIHIEEPIKTVGNHTVILKLFHGVNATIKIEVHRIEE